MTATWSKAPVTVVLADRCAACGKAIVNGTTVRRWGGREWHPACFEVQEARRRSEFARDAADTCGCLVFYPMGTFDLQEEAEWGPGNCNWQLHECGCHTRDGSHAACCGLLGLSVGSVHRILKRVQA